MGNRVMKMNNLVDSHVHCDYSDDCHIPALSQIERAIELGLKGIAFTDHYDIGYPNPRYTFEFDVSARRKNIHDMAIHYERKLSLLHGIEIGIQPHVINQSAEVIKNGQFDCVICSTHAVEGFSLCSQSGFFEGKTKQGAYNRYLDEIYSAISQFHEYDIVGHIGYVRRYGPYANRSMPYKEFSDAIDRILKKVIEDGKGIEINTSGFAYKLGSTIPEIDIIVRYKQLGGEIITIGSDAHTKERVADNFDQALAILQHVGFNYVAYFKNRKPVFNKL